jgi:hypothetical protein
MQMTLSSVEKAEAAIEGATEFSDIDQTPAFEFSICTLVSRIDDYKEMVSSFRSKGFGTDDSEYLYVDNSRGNKLDGFAGLDFFLAHARGRYIIICHQDVVLADDRAALEARLAELTKLDPEWGVCGNAGCTDAGEPVIRISDPNGEDTRRGAFPSEIIALDENFVVVPKRANLTVSRGLRGFHLYAVDLCHVAAVLGLKSYVIDFHVVHKSAGTFDEVFLRACQDAVAFHSSKLRPKILASPASTLFISGWPVLDRIGDRLLKSRFRRHAFWLAKVLKG